ncbi:MAG TPA: hypothetical protein VLC93_05075, partial [Myxococcota bacterium]|nr:hypothetical protein [Myxococcota bacterium]
GDQAERLLKDLPRGQEWGILRGPFGNARTNPVTFQAVLKEIGLREWRRYRFVPYDVELVIAGLKKLGPVTPEQRLRIQANALDIMSKYHNHHETSEALQADLVAAVRELARRAPSAPHLGDLKPVQAST